MRGELADGASNPSNAGRTRIMKKHKRKKQKESERLGSWDAQHLQNQIGSLAKRVEDLERMYGTMQAVKQIIDGVKAVIR
jgi:hypothetical protein